VCVHEISAADLAANPGHSPPLVGETDKRASAGANKKDEITIALICACSLEAAVDAGVTKSLKARALLPTPLLPPRGFPLMQSTFAALLSLSLCVGAALAQTGAPVVPSATPPVEPGKEKAYAAAIANCEGMWDRGTHMTRKEWSRTCRRVQNRLQQMELR
jgi:hypothetical protein